jgi:hypothetical protein
MHLQGGADVLPDWRVVARPPLVLHNALPVPARFSVWERFGGSGGPMRCRQQGSLGPWESRSLYTVDMRQQVRRQVATCSMWVWVWVWVCGCGCGCG